MTAYAEDHLIEQPAIQLMEHELGWNSVNAYDDPSSPPTSPRLRGPGRLRWTGWASCDVKPLMPEQAIEGAVEEVTRDRSALSLVEVNREIDTLIFLF